MARPGASAWAAPRSGDGVRLVLDGEIVRAGAVSPQTSLLEFLREQLDHTITKEGCAEGDCGACTVVLAGRTGEGALHWRRLNACIRLLPSIDGKALVTVESLKSRTGALHPVQQALVECQASQCRFCGRLAADGSRRRRAGAAHARGCVANREIRDGDPLGQTRLRRHARQRNAPLSRAEHRVGIPA